MRKIFRILTCAGAALALGGCGPRAGASAAGEAGEGTAAPGAARASSPSGIKGALAKFTMSDDEKAYRAGIWDDQGRLLPPEIIAETDMPDRIEAAAKADPGRVFAYYRELKASGVCDEKADLRSSEAQMYKGQKVWTTRNPEFVCGIFLHQAVKHGDPDANFEMGMENVRTMEVLYRGNRAYNESALERTLELAQQQFTIAQQSTTPGVAESARKTLAEFQTLQYSRGYGGAAADRMRAVFLGAMAITVAGELGKMSDAMQQDCRNRQFGAAMALQKGPTC